VSLLAGLVAKAEDSLYNSARNDAKIES